MIRRLATDTVNTHMRPMTNRGVVARAALDAAEICIALWMLDQMTGRLAFVLGCWTVVRLAMFIGSVFLDPMVDEEKRRRLGLLPPEYARIVTHGASHPNGGMQLAWRRSESENNEPGKGER